MHAFVSWVAEQTQIAAFRSETSPAYLHTDAKLAGQLRNTPIPGGMAFIDLQGLDNATDYITHVVIVESVDGNKVHVIRGSGILIRLSSRALLTRSVMDT